MRRLLLTAGGAALGVTAYRLARRRSAAAPDGNPRSHAVTVFRPIDEIRDRLPEPITRLGDAVTVELREAPAGRGTEIHVRRVAGDVSDGDIRAALRTGRSLLETGDVLHAGGPTTKPTLLNRPLRAATEHGREGGLL